jgi:hypothetical protein
MKSYEEIAALNSKVALSAERLRARRWRGASRHPPRDAAHRERRSAGAWAGRVAGVRRPDRVASMVGCSAGRRVRARELPGSPSPSVFR